MGSWGNSGNHVTSRTNARRWGTATLIASTAGAALAISCALVLAGCTAASPAESSAAATESSVPLPSPTGTWTAPAADATDGPATAAPLPTQSASIEEPIQLGTEVEVALVSVTSTTVTASTPGEVDGPAVVVKVKITNNSTETVDVSSAVVSLTAADGEYGVQTTAGPNQPLAGTIAPGASTEGSYVFMLDPAKGRAVIVSVNYSAGEPVAVFTGKTS